MNALTILARCRSAETDKRRIRQQIERRREAITCISPRMDANGGGRSTAEQDKIGAFVAAVTELEQRLKLREQAQSGSLCPAGCPAGKRKRSAASILCARWQSTSHRQAPGVLRKLYPKDQSRG